jgi:RND family efflux transporter MFP subunit
MSVAGKSPAGWPVKLGVGLVVLAAVYFGVSYALRPVAQVMAVVRGKAVRWVPGTVEVKAEFANELKSEVSGRVSSTELEIGKKVQRGDVLIQLDTGDVDLDIERIKNDITSSRKKVELGSTLRPDVLNSKDTLDTLERQTKAGAYPAAEFEKAKRTHHQLELKMELDEVANKLALDTNENSLRVKQREKAKMTITAPSDGVITDVIARVGDLIDRSSTIANIIATGRTIEAKLSEENFAAVKLGQKATVRFLTFGGDHYNAVITKVLPAADPTTQRYSVFLDVTLPEGRILTPGITGEVTVIIAQRDNSLLIPARALIGDYVYVVEGSKVALRKVVKGYESTNLIEIMSGVKEGDSVIVEQLDRFHDGQRVRTKVLEN